MKDYPNVMSQIHPINKVYIPEYNWDKSTTDRSKLPKYDDLYDYYNHDYDRTIKTLKEVREHNDELLKQEGLKNGFWKRLDSIMRDKNVSIAELSQQTKIPQTTICTWSSGTMPSMRNMMKLSSALDASIDYLLNGETRKSGGTEKVNNQSTTREICSPKDLCERMKALMYVANREERITSMKKMLITLLRLQGYGDAIDIFEKALRQKS